MDQIEIMNALRAPIDKYPREAVQAAMDQKDDIVSPLLDELKQALEDPEQYIERTYSSFAIIHVIVLLGYHRVHEAQALIAALLRLPGEMPTELFGDALFEIVPQVLWQTAAGDTAEILELIRNREINEYCRTSAIAALMFGVADKTVPRNEAVTFLNGLFTKDEAEPDEATVWSEVAWSLSDLWPGDSMDVLRKAYDEELIDPAFISMEDIDNDFQKGKEAMMSAFEERRLRDLAKSPHDELSRWSCFNTSPSPVTPSFRDISVSNEKNRAAAKKKRKQARTSRRKGRAKKK
jgi:hypothetical protein